MSDGTNRSRTALAEWAQKNYHWPPTYVTRAITSESGNGDEGGSVFFQSTVCIEGLTHPGGFANGVGHTGGFANTTDGAQERAAYEAVTAVTFAEEQLAASLNDLPYTEHILYNKEGVAVGSRILTSDRFY